WKMTKKAGRTLWRHKGLFIGITLIYGVLNLLLAQGIGGTDVSGVKSAFNQAFTGHFGALFSGLSVFTLLVGSAGNNTSQTSGSYQILLAIVASLAIIWGLRQSLSGTVVSVRDAYYKGMYPLVPFILVLLVIALQLVPIVVGSTLYALVTNNGIAAHGGEQLFWFAIFAASAFATLYMLSSSLFALYIVTLPDMTPRKALRSARGLVRGRRWAVLRKILWLPLFLLVAAAIIMVPIIILLAPVARWIFFLLTMSVLTAAHAYMYTFYRELLNE
ncbi:MAG: hypothetical protein ACREMY_25750, partial [bacterium]